MKSLRSVVTTVVGLGIFLVGGFAPAAERLDPKDVPEPLKPWIGWVLDSHEGDLCPSLSGAGRTRACTWPAKISLELDGRGGRFTQEWTVYGSAWVPLPGDAKRWPLDVRAGGKAAPVIRRGTAPRVLLPGGTSTITGRFAWDSIPEMIQIPPETGIVSLTVGGRRVEFPARDEKGRLWLQRDDTAEVGESRLEVVVHRKVSDEVPLEMVTDVVLKVSGKNREAILAPALPPGFVPVSLTGPIPARIEKDGRLRVQVRPGTWRLALAARHEGPTEAISLPDLPPDAGPWDDDEVWVFDARPALRIVSVEGVAPIDPEQTELPEAWRALPAYLVEPGDTMTLDVRRRGDEDPAPDRLSLDRTFWLDFNGAGYTVQDRLQGTLSRSWRLEMGPETELGRVASEGRDQLITRSDAGERGIELRRSRVSLEADSRIEDARSSVPAVSWNHDFESVGGRLHLPPGWRLVHATGVDDASPTWISEWDLLDLFLLLILTLSAGKLWGWRLGALAFVTLTLTWQEPGAPRWIWLFLVAGEALVRVLPKGFFLKALRAYRLGVWGLLVLITIPFLVTQARYGLYPQLEPTWNSGGMGFLGRMQSKSPARRGILGDFADEEVQLNFMAPPEAGLHEFSKGELSSLEQKQEVDSRSRLKSKVQSLDNLYAPDPSAQVSTGPGLPSWSWRQVSLSWRGPVTASQRIRLFLEPPWLRGLLCFARIGLLTALLLFVVGIPPAELRRWRRNSSGIATASAMLALMPVFALGAALFLFAPGVAHSAERSAVPPPGPSPEILQELQRRLLRPAACAPDCAEAGRLRIEASASTLRLRLELSAGAQTAAPLPGGARQWSPERVTVDGRPAALHRTSDGRLWVALTPGVHQVVMEGALPDRESVAIPLPLRPHHVEVRSNGWSVSGIHEDGVPDDNLQLTRLRAASDADRSISQEALEPFVRVERELLLGLSWQVETRVVRLSPPGVPVVLEVPLLPGESVTSADVRVAGGRAQVSMGPTTSVAGWTSVLAESPSITLTAPDSAPWVESWRVDASPVWHLEAGGIPAVHAQPSDEERVREWRPWPGETVTLDVSRPQGIGGAILTLDHANLTLSPGLRATDATLVLSMRASRGTQHSVTIPENAELTSIVMNGVVQPVRQEGREVTLTVPPGSHTATLAWRQPEGIQPGYRSPEVDAGAPVANAGVTVEVPSDRWTLFLRGPRLGPAVLFWSLLTIYLLVSILLGLIRWTPLRWWHWFLLALGLTQVPVPVAALAVSWLLALGRRKDQPVERPELFNLVQVALPVLVLIGLASLLGSMAEGLLGYPEMQIRGNGSNAGTLRWYADRVPGVLPEVRIVSVPLYVYRLAMLAWATWIALSLLSWLTWGWGCYTHGGLWKPIPGKVKPSTPPAPTT